METVLIVIHLMVVICLVVVIVVFQRSEGGVLGQGGGGGFMTGRGQANALTRATAILAGLFFATSLALTILANYSRKPKTIFDNAAPGTATPVAPAIAPPADPGNALDALKQFEQQRQRQSLPAPAVPAPETTPGPVTQQPPAADPAPTPEAPKP